MRRLIVLLVAAVLALLGGGTALAAPDGVSPPPPPGGDERTFTAAAAKLAWQMSRESNTGYRHAFTGQWTPLTGERIGYWGASDASYPRVGDLYYGVAEVFNYGNPVGDGSTTVNFEVKLPPKTRFDVDPGVLKRKIRCYWFKPADNTSGEFTGKRWEGNGCPLRTTSGGIHGARFLPPTNDGTWRLPPGYGIAVVFPIVSTAPLKGYANTPAPACIIGSVWAAGGGTPDGRVWDAPTAGDSCPLPQYHGTDRPVIVSPDVTKPRVARVIPAENATRVAPGANVSAVFSEAMRKGSISSRTVKLYRKGSNKALAATVTYDARSRKAVLNPKANLLRGKAYKAVVTPGAKDLAGNPLDQSPTRKGNQPKTWFFTVKK